MAAGRDRRIQRERLPVVDWDEISQPLNEQLKSHLVLNIEFDLDVLRRRNTKTSLVLDLTCRLCLEREFAAMRSRSSTRMERNVGPILIDRIILPVLRFEISSDH